MTSIKLLKLVKTPLNVALRKTDVINWLLLRVILTSKKEKKSFCSNFEVICPDYFMASLDIESLFTSIPLNEVIDICIDDLFCDTNTIQNLDRNDMRELLNLTAYESFFIFDQVMYRQIDGVAMGSPLGPILTNAFLCHFEKQWLSECPPDFLPKVFKRYVDDIFVMFLCQRFCELHEH